MARVAIALIVLAALAAAVAVAMRLARAVQGRAASSTVPAAGLPAAPEHPARKLSFTLLMALILYVSVYGGQAAVTGGAG